MTSFKKGDKVRVKAGRTDSWSGAEGIVTGMTVGKWGTTYVTLKLTKPHTNRWDVTKVGFEVHFHATSLEYAQTEAERAAIAKEEQMVGLLKLVGSRLKKTRKRIKNGENLNSIDGDVRLSVLNLITVSRGLVELEDLRNKVDTEA